MPKGVHGVATAGLLSDALDRYQQCQQEHQLLGQTQLPALPAHYMLVWKLQVEPGSAQLLRMKRKPYRCEQQAYLTVFLQTVSARDRCPS